MVNNLIKKIIIFTVVPVLSVGFSGVVYAKFNEQSNSYGNQTVQVEELFLGKVSLDEYYNKVSKFMEIFEQKDNLLEIQYVDNKEKEKEKNYISQELENSNKEMEVIQQIKEESPQEYKQEIREVIEIAHETQQEIQQETQQETQQKAQQEAQQETQQEAQQETHQETPQETQQVTHQETPQEEHQEAQEVEEVNDLITSYSNSSEELLMLTLVNEEREKQGLTTLQFDETLYHGAKIRGIEITNVFSHTRPDGSSCFSAGDGISGENISYSNADHSAHGAYKQFYNSVGHRENMLYDGFTRFACNRVISEGTAYWVQVYGF